MSRSNSSSKTGSAAISDDEFNFRTTRYIGEYLPSALHLSRNPSSKKRDENRRSFSAMMRAFQLHRSLLVWARFLELHARYVLEFSGYGETALGYEESDGSGLELDSTKGSRVQAIHFTEEDFLDLAYLIASDILAAARRTRVDSGSVQSLQLEPVARWAWQQRLSRFTPEEQAEYTDCIEVAIGELLLSTFTGEVAIRQELNRVSRANVSVSVLTYLDNLNEKLDKGTIHRLWWRALCDRKGLRTIMNVAEFLEYKLEGYGEEDADAMRYFAVEWIRRLEEQIVKDVLYVYADLEERESREGGARIE